ncbi:hypothetical protein KAR91_31090, partial [Candidatus Pacearchaeota archaeon]|nr:hypothetical protein [Candidatus Pacearchaeota archaeon]
PSRLTPEGFVVAPGKDIALESDPELYEAAIKLKKGDLSLPLIINGTFHLILLEHHQPRRDKSEKQAKASIVQKLKSSKRNQLLVQWRQGLLKGANIEIVHELLQ